MKTLPNIHPGEILLEEFLQPMGISQNALARAADVPPRRINEIAIPACRPSQNRSLVPSAAASRTAVSAVGRRGVRTGRNRLWVLV